MTFNFCILCVQWTLKWSTKDAYWRKRKLLEKAHQQCLSLSMHMQREKRVENQLSNELRFIVRNPIRHGITLLHFEMKKTWDGTLKTLWITQFMLESRHKIENSFLSLWWGSSFLWKYAHSFVLFLCHRIDQLEDEQVMKLKQTIIKYWFTFEWCLCHNELSCLLLRIWWLFDHKIAMIHLKVTK